MIDFKDINMDRVIAITNKINKVDASYIEVESDIIYEQHPFLISMIMGYTQDYSPKESDQMTRLFFMIWEYFKDKPKIKNYQITQDVFEKHQTRNGHLLKYLEAESPEQMQRITTIDIKKLKALDLFAAISYLLNHQIPLKNSATIKKSIALIGLKSIIESFEEKYLI